MDPLLYLLIYLPLRSHGQIPLISPPIWCFSGRFFRPNRHFSRHGKVVPAGLQAGLGRLPGRPPS